MEILNTYNVLMVKFEKLRKVEFKILQYDFYEGFQLDFDEETMKVKDPFPLC